MADKIMIVPINCFAFKNTSILNFDLPLFNLDLK